MSNKTIQIKAELAKALNRKNDLEAGINNNPSEGILIALESNLKEVIKEIATLEDELKKSQEHDKLNFKDWEQVMVQYPELRIYHQKTFELGEGITYDTLQAKLALKAAESGEKAMLIEGPSGTGKTTFFRYLGVKLNRPVISINASNGMTEEDLLGKWGKNADGVPTFFEGVLLLAMRTGSIIVIEEINGAKPSVLMMMNSLLDDLEMVEHPAHKGVSITPEPGFMLGGTLNLGYAGTRKLNKAFINRFPVAFQMTDITRTGFNKIVTSKLPDVTEEELKISWYIYKSISNVIKREEYDSVISVRQAINIIKMKRFDSHYADGRMKHTWKAAIDMAVRSQVTGFEDDMSNEIDRVSEAVYTHIDKKTNVFNDNALPMFEPLMGDKEVSPKESA